jgi:two-component system cell cycle response regulator
MARILIIDDSRVIIHVARTILTKNGHHVRAAQDGLAGLEEARVQCPDLILLDLVMPLMDGYEVCQELKSDPATRKVPVIMLTSKAEPADKVKGLESGALDYVTKPFDEAELIARVNIHLRLKELYQSLQAKNRQLQELVNRDGLTGLYNHRYFYEQLSTDFLKAKRYGEPLSTVMLDIDHFKRCNDTYGHQTGDLILEGLARLLEASIRDSDLAARYGGEEFALILYHTDLPGAIQAVERIRNTVKTHEFQKDGLALQITVSAGIATFPHPEIHEPNDLIQRADMALYAAKQKGRDRIEFYGRR